MDGDFQHYHYDSCRPSLPGCESQEARSPSRRFYETSTLALESLTWWAIANGLGAHTSELNNYELGVQYKVKQAICSSEASTNNAVKYLVVNWLCMAFRNGVLQALDPLVLHSHLYDKTV